MNEIAIIEPKEYKIMTADISDLSDLMSEAAGPEGLNVMTDLERITTPSGGGNFWELPTLTGTESAKTIQGIIIASKNARSYWVDSDQMGNPPDCFSNDALTGNGNPGGNCLACPLAEFESASKGSGQACKSMKNIFFVTNDSVMPSILSVPPTSLKAAKEYLLKLTSKLMPFYSVITEFGLENAENADKVKYSRVTFRAISQITGEELSAMKAYASSIKETLIEA